MVSTPRNRSPFPKRQYWDSALFITLTTTQMTEVGQQRVAIIRELLELHEQKTIEIVVSTMVIAEFRPYTEGALPDPEMAKLVDGLFNSTDILLYALTPRIAMLAREIGERNPSLTPTDAIHIATAIVAEADVLFTFDGSGKRRRPKHMLGNSGRIGTPPLRITEPFVDYGPLINNPMT